MTAKQDYEVLTGTLMKWYPPKGRQAGTLYMDVADDDDSARHGETIKLTIWPAKGEERPFDEDMPLADVMERRDPYDLLDKKVRVIAAWKSEYQGTHQYTPSQLKVVGRDAEPSTPQAKTPVAPSTAPEAPAKMSRSELGAATGNAVSASTEFVTGYYETTKTLPDRETVIEAARLINIMSEEILTRRTGEIDPEEIIEEPFPETPEDDHPDGAIEV
jgi:hypothetical protein